MNNLWKRCFSLVLALVMVVGMCPMNAFAKTVDKPLADADGILWLYNDENSQYGGASNEFVNMAIVEFKLDDMIRTAIGEENNESTKVTYNDGNFDVDVGTEGIFAVAGTLANEVSDVLKTKQLIVFKVGDVEKNIAVRTIQGVNITLGANGEIVISSEGAPADLDAQIDAILNDPSAHLVIKHGNDQASLDKARHVVTSEKYDYHWPTAEENENGGVVAGAVTVTVNGDDKGSQSATANVILRDTRTVKANVYDYSTPSDAGETVTHYYYDGETAPEVPGEITDAYYNWGAWELAADENNVATYLPAWAPKLDKSGPDKAEPDGIADQKQSFVITYVDGETVDKHEPVAYGGKMPAANITAVNPDESKFSWGGWVDANGNSPAQTVTGAVTYYPNWTEDPIVTFEIWFDEEYEDSYPKVATKQGDKYVLVPDDTYIPGYILHMAFSDYHGELTPSVGPFEVPDNGKVTVQYYYYSDRNENGGFDGTDGDPYHVYEYYLPGSETANQKVTVLESDKFDPKSVEYPAEHLLKNQKFMGWNVPEEGTKNEFMKELGLCTFVTYTYKCEPIIITDANNNDIDDVLEMDTVTIEGMSYEFVDGKLKVTDGEFTGWVEIAGLMSDGNGGVKFSYDPVKTVISATPLWNADKSAMSHYVAGIKVNDEPAGSYDNFNLVAGPVAEANGVALAAEDNVNVKITYTPATKFETPGTNNLKPGQDSYAVEEVYAAAVSSPSFSNAITLQYEAREVHTASVDLSILMEQLNAKGLGYLAAGLDGYLGEGQTYSHEVPAMYLDVTASVTTQTADEIAGDYFNELLGKVIKENGEPDMTVVSQLGGPQGILDELNRRLNEGVNLHKFGAVAVGETSTKEKVSITYQTDAEYAHADVDLVIEDNRASSVINVKQARLVKSYGSFTNDDLLKNVELQGPTSGELKLDANYSIKSVGEYQVMVSFKGNETHKGCDATFTLVVEQVNPTVTVPELITVLKGGTYNPAPSISPSYMPYVHMIAGFEMSEVEFSETELIKNREFVLADNDVVVKVWLKLPGLLSSVVTNMGIELDEEGFTDIENVEKALDKNIDENSQNYYKDVVDELMAKVHPLIAERLNLQDVNISLKVRVDTIGDQTYPFNPGFYMNIAANLPAITEVANLFGGEIPAEFAPYLEDENYAPKLGAGFIAITPMFPIPNSGGVQLYYKDVNDTQNVFVFENGTQAALKVAVDNVTLEGATPTYYGLSTTSVLPVTGVPSNPGLYIAYYNHCEGDNVSDPIGPTDLRRLGSDVAVIVIKQTPVSMEIAGKTVTYDGDAHLPEIIVKDEDSNVINDAAVTVISGSVNSGEVTDVRDLHANVNIDFPDTLDNLWGKFWEYKGQAAPNTATPNDVVEFLEYCKNGIISGSQETIDLMEALGIPKGIVDESIESKLENGIDQTALTLQALLDRATIYLDRLMAEVKKIGAKFDDEVSMSIKDLDELNYSATGYYLFAGIVTDPQYTPAVGAGVMTIESDKVYEFHETHVPYDGKHHFIDIESESTRDSIFIIVDNNGDYTKVNFDMDDMDDTLSNILKDVLIEAGYELVEGSDTTVANAYIKGEAKITDLAQGFVDAIVNRIDENALVNELTDRITEASKAAVAKLYPEGSDKYEAALNKMLDEKIPAAINELKNERIPNFANDILTKLQELDHLEDDTVIIINGDHPVEVGEYQFYGYNYDVAKASGTLFIEPREIEIKAVVTPDTYTVGSGDATPVVTYEVKLNGELINDQHEIYVELGLTHDINLAQAIQTVGDYTITPQYNDLVNSVITHEEAVLHVVEPAVTEVVFFVDDKEITCGETPDFTVTIKDTDGNVVDPGDGEFTFYYYVKDSEGNRVEVEDVANLPAGVYTIMLDGFDCSNDFVSMSEPTNGTLTVLKNQIVVNMSITPNPYLIGSNEGIELTYNVTMNGDPMAEEEWKDLLGYTTEVVLNADNMEPDGNYLEIAGEYTINPLLTKLGALADYADVVVNPAKLTVKEAGIGDGTIDAVYTALLLENEVHHVVSFTVSDFDGLYESIDPETYEVKDIGLLVYYTRKGESADCTIENADRVISTGGYYDPKEDKFRIEDDQGIPAKEMDVDVWYKAYVLTENGYVYSPRVKESPLNFSTRVLTGNEDAAYKKLCMALMNYGSAAQRYFFEPQYPDGFPASKQMNYTLSEYASLVEPFADTMITPTDSINRELFDVVENMNVFNGISFNLTLEGTLTAGFVFKTTANTQNCGMLIWTEEMYKAGKTSIKDAIVIPANQADIEGGDFYVGYTGLAAKEMGKTFYVCGYAQVGDEMVYSRVMARSIDYICNNVLVKQASDAYQNLAKQMVVYGEYAKKYFNSGK